MPLYFIDTDDDVLAVRDEEGHDLPDTMAARALVHRVLPEMAQLKMPNGEHRTFTASVRDESGASLYVATLTLAGAWTVPSSTSEG